MVFDDDDGVITISGVPTPPKPQPPKPQPQPQPGPQVISGQPTPVAPVKPLSHGFYDDDQKTKGNGGFPPGYPPVFFAPPRK